MLLKRRSQTDWLSDSGFRAILDCFDCRIEILQLVYKEVKGADDCVLTDMIVVYVNPYVRRWFEHQRLTADDEAQALIKEKTE